MSERTIKFDPAAYAAWVEKRGADKAAKREREIEGWQKAKAAGLVQTFQLPHVPRFSPQAYSRWRQQSVEIQDTRRTAEIADWHRL